MAMSRRFLILLLALWIGAVTLLPTQALAADAGETYRWTKVSGTIPSERFFPGIVYDKANRQIGLFGGIPGTSYLCRDKCFNEMWIWDGDHQTWTNVTPPGMTDAGTANWPSARAYPGMVYDEAHGYVLMFGGLGQDNNRLGDTWKWDGKKWERLITAHTPTPSDSPLITYDGANGEVVMFGGMIANSDVVNETWVWNGTDWIQKFPENAPSPRQASGMVYDGAHREVVLFGGDDTKHSNYYNDTWVWDGSNWTEKQPTNPPSARSYMGAAYDGYNVSLFGGMLRGQSTDETWSWDGDSWSKVPGLLPVKRAGLAMALDDDRKQLVLVNGEVWTAQLPMVTHVRIESDINAAGGTAVWTARFNTSPIGGLTGGSDTITLRAPSGTHFPEQASAYSVNGQPAVDIVQAGAGAVTVTTPVNIDASSPVTLAVKGMINPDGENYLPNQFGISTSKDDRVSYPAETPVFRVPAAITLEGVPDSTVPGGQVSVTGSVYDSNREAVFGADLNLEADAGSFEPNTVTTDQDGNFHATFTAPSSPGKVTLTAAAKVNGVTSSQTVEVKGIPSSNATLSGIYIDGEELPGFEPTVTSYTYNVPNGRDHVTVTAVVYDSASIVKVEGDPQLAVGDNIFKLTVTAEDESVNVYTVNVVRAAPMSSNATLSGIFIDGEELPGFEPTVTGYTYNLPYRRSHVTVTAAVYDPASTVKVEGDPQLSVGNNVFTITVAAEDGSANVYTVNVIRAAASSSPSPKEREYVRSNNADLRGLKLSAGDLTPKLTPDFTPDITSYRAEVAGNVDFVTVTPETADAKATVQVNGQPVKSSQPSGAIPLNEGDNEIRITVTAENGSSKSYHVVVTRAAAACRVSAIAFTDIKGHWGAKDIEQAAQKCLVTGYPDGTFRPDLHVTRLEFTVMLVRGLQLHGEGVSLPFQDDIPSWAAAEAGLAIKAGIVNGYPDGTFRPNAQVSRAEMAVIAARALGLVAVHGLAFADADSIPAWAKDKVAAAQQNGLMIGRSGSRFAPHEAVTRAEAAVLLLRMLSLSEQIQTDQQ